MTLKTLRNLTAGLAVAAMLAVTFQITPARAQETERELLGSFRDWDAFLIRRGDGVRECYMISQPTETRPRNVNRGDIYAMVTHKPALDIRNQVMIDVGYPFRPGSEAAVTISGRAFRLFTEDDAAWAYTPRDDNQLVEAMRAGSTMGVRGTSSRGTDTRDTYSLMGFTAAHNAISEACSG